MNSEGGLHGPGWVGRKDVASTGKVTWAINEAGVARASSRLRPRSVIAARETEVVGSCRSGADKLGQANLVATFRRVSLVAR